MQLTILKYTYIIICILRIISINSFLKYFGYRSVKLCQIFVMMTCVNKLHIFYSKQMSRINQNWFTCRYKKKLRRCKCLILFNFHNWTNCKNITFLLMNYTIVACIKIKSLRIMISSSVLEIGSKILPEKIWILIYIHLEIHVNMRIRKRNLKNMLLRNNFAHQIIQYTSYSM